MTNSHQEPQEGWRKRFGDKFIHRGNFGERRLNIFFVTNWTRGDPIIHDEDVVLELEKFMLEEFAHQNAEHQKLIFEECESAKRLERERIIGLLEGTKLPELLGAYGPYDEKHIQNNIGFNSGIDRAITLINDK